MLPPFPADCPVWMMSSGFSLSARSTISAAVESDMANASGGADAVPRRAFRLRSWESRARRGFRDHCRCGIGRQQSGGDHFAGAACGPIGQFVSLPSRAPAINRTNRVSTY